MPPSDLRPLYLDCDTGIDDALALVYLLREESQTRLVGIGTVSGNVSSEQAARNTLDLLALAERTDIPVAKGSADPLRGNHVAATHVHGSNGIGGIQLPTSEQQVVPETAAELLIRLAHQYDGMLSIIAIGPLTNIALALEQDPSIPTKIARIIIMGGAINVPGNVSATAEANIAHDPEAAAQVFAADWHVDLVPLDLTMQHRFDQDHHDLFRSGDSLTRSLASMLDAYFAFYTPILGAPLVPLHDPLAAAIASGTLTPTRWSTGTVAVELFNPESRGRTRFTRSDLPSARIRVVLSAPRLTANRLAETILGRSAARETAAVAVVGSINDDITVRTTTRPAPGETILGRGLDHAPGGKGLNQANASVRAGAPTALIGAVGTDAAGSDILQHPTLRLLDTRFVKKAATPTGTAVITLTTDGENSIIVISGANDKLTVADVVLGLDQLQPKVVVTQLEIPIAAARAAAQWSEWNDARFILNYSPFRDDARDLLERADPVLVNAHEAALLGDATSLPDLAVQMSSEALSVIITDGPRGSYSLTRGDILQHTPAPTVSVVDTTGAGDTFTGTLAAALHVGAALREATVVATQAAAHAIQQARAERA